MRKIPIFSMLIAAIVLAGCGASPTQTASSPNSQVLVTQNVDTPVPLATASPVSTNKAVPVFPVEGENTPMAPVLPTPYAPGLQSLIDQARNDLAKRLSIAAVDIDVAGASREDWPDASLGCPKMGVMYIQVVTPGFQIILEAGGKLYIYHTDDRQRIVFCPDLRPGVETPPSLNPDK